MAVTQRTRPRLWVQPTVFGNWYSVLGQEPKAKNQKPRTNGRFWEAL
jgi:hypothetical protein